jgi:hypothetical protein
MDAISAAGAEERPLKRSEIRAILTALAQDWEHDERRPPLPRGLPRVWPLGARQWAEIVALIQCREAFRDEPEDPLPCPHPPGSEGKIRTLRRRFGRRQPLFLDRDKQLAPGERTVAGSCRFLSKLADAAREASRRVASARGKACSAAARRNGNGVAE